MIPENQQPEPTMQGISLRDWFAGQCDVSVYHPAQTFHDAKGHAPSVKELAAYIAEMRLLEADAMMEARGRK